MDGDERELPERKHDESLVGYLRRLSVAERLELNDASVRVALKLRESFRRRGDRDDSRRQ